MNADTINSIINIHDNGLVWSNKPTVLHGNVCIDLSAAVGKDARTPSNAPNQPSVYNKLTCYMFDPTKFFGEKAFPDIRRLIETACPGCSFLLQKGAEKRDMTITWSLRCSHYLPRKTISTTKNGKFTREGVRSVTFNRNKRSQNAFSRMHHAKLKSKQRKNERNKEARKTKVPKVKAHRRTSGKRAENKERRCHMNVRVFMLTTNQCWYLSKSSNFQHTFHSFTDQNACTIARSNISGSHNCLMKLLYQHDVPNQAIAAVMTEVLNKDGVDGELLSNTVRNVNKSTDNALDKIKGISADWSVAEKTLSRLAR